MFVFDAELWIWDVRRTDTWTFVTLPEDVSDQIRDIAPPGAGFGAVKVRVGVGASNWSTSVFPDKQSGCYVLPIKAAVRKKNGVEPGDVVEVTVEVV
ncbi:DUF1905 domain-containing protein [Lentzea sp. NPDC051208]|uniref:DUF1905 domain-containing protein n=1 Tax=Lentzea sp. NPDC051208 TaxID=3154642 RepID=UPI003412E88B